MHIAIIGAGRIGRLVGFNLLTDSALFTRGAARLDKLTFIGRAGKECEGIRRDFIDAGRINGLMPEICFAGDDAMAAISGADSIIIAASAARVKNGTREDLLHANKSLAKNIGRAIGRYAPRAFIIIVSNPLDIMAALVQHYAQCRPQQICGAGQWLDTVRSRRIAPKYGADSGADICVVGPHGAAMLPVLDRLELADSAAARQEIIDEGYALVRLNGSAIYAPAANIIAILRHYMADSGAVLPLCACYNGVYIGVLASVSAKGVSGAHLPPMSAAEQAAFAQAAADLQKTVAALVAEDEQAAAGKANG